MRRCLLITRHAEAGWEDGPSSDHERILTAHGRQQARELAALLAERRWLPQALVSSTALRATHTAQLVAHELGIDGALSRHQVLYQGGFEALRRALEDVDDDVERVMVVGHNPAMSSIASRLTGRNLSLHTATCVALHCETDSWEEAIDEEWVLDGVLRPEESTA